MEKLKVKNKNSEELRDFSRQELIDLVIELRQSIEEQNSRYQKELVFAESLISSLPGIFYLLSKDMRIRRWNRNFELVTGYSTGEIATLTPAKLVPPGHARTIKNKIDRVFEYGKGVMEFPLLTRSGRTVPFLFSGISIELDGSAYVIGTGFDISDRLRVENQVKSSLREKEVLLSEIHHRVKNNLAIVASLLHMQAHCIDDDKLRDLIRESESRIHTMGMIHEMLYQQENLSRIDFRSYTRKLINYLAVGYRTEEKNINSELTATKINLDISNAVPCALILHELVTNAYKHAFISRKSGKVSVSLSQKGKTCKLSVQDDGIGYPPDTNKSSMGISLVSGLVEQIFGNLSVESSNGTTVTVFFQTK